MNPLQSLQVFILATASLESTRTFYTKIDDKYKRLKEVSTPNVFLMTLADKRFPYVPLFTMENGVPITKTGKEVRVFGMLHNYFAIGQKKHIKPLKLQLDDDFRILNVHMNFCTSPLSFLPKIAIEGNSDTEGIECSPMEVYFLTPAEAKEIKDDVKEIKDNVKEIKDNVKEIKNNVKG